MAELISPLLKGKPYESTSHRYNSMFQPIQKTKTKESDITAFFVTPLLDYFILDTAFALDISIRLLNATASLLKAAYLWVMNQQATTGLMDNEASIELKAANENFNHIAYAFIAQICNIVLSTLSLITRPIASIVEAMNNREALNESFQTSL
jgi:hypothetical protein